MRVFDDGASSSRNPSLDDLSHVLYIKALNALISIHIIHHPNHNSQNRVGGTALCFTEDDQRRAHQHHDDGKLCTAS